MANGRKGRKEVVVQIAGEQGYTVMCPACQDDQCCTVTSIGAVAWWVTKGSATAPVVASVQRY